MSKTFNFENALIPVTALAFLDVGCLYLIAGEGPEIKIYEHHSGNLVSRRRVFKSESVHGIICCVPQHGDQKAKANLLLWGGRSLCFVELVSREPTIVAPLSFDLVLTEVRTDDWVLDACFNPFANEADDYLSAPLEAVAVTTNTRLQRFRFPAGDSLAIQDSVRLENAPPHNLDRCGSRTNALLYSAHISWSRKDYADGRILVATGTVLGEVHLWSSEYSRMGSHGVLQLHYTFTGHLGSVFGVRLGETVDLLNGSVTRLLASCSDDRTIRIWDVSDLKTSYPVIESKTCVATVMGHASRIWAVQFLSGSRTIPQILSLGEDGSAQVWLLEPASERKQLQKNLSRDLMGLVHTAEYHFHSGKHIWAVAVLDKGNGSSLIATGGADGRIVSFYRDIPFLKAPQRTLSCQSTMSQLKETPKGAVTCREAPPKKKAVFKGLQGHWRLFRTLRSALATYPSGTFDGTANFECRPATDSDFDEECLYSEEGNFNADTGFTVKATRQYVYRYQQQIDELTIWFVKTEGRGLVDYLFHSLDFTNEDEETHMSKSIAGKTIWTAKGHHLCLDDAYAADYQFIFVGPKLEEWRVRFFVHGPQKNYVTDATFTRSSSNSDGAQTGAFADHIATADPMMQYEPTGIDVFKKYAWVSDSEFLTTTDLGNVLRGTPDAPRGADKGDACAPAIIWDSVSQKIDLTASYLVTSIPSLGIAFLIDDKGRVFRYYSESKALQLTGNRPEKPAYIRAQEIRLQMTENRDSEYRDWDKVFDCMQASKSASWISLVTTSLTSDRAIISLHTSDGHQTTCIDYDCSIELPKNFVVTSSCLLDKDTLVILGSRKGDLFIYDPLMRCCNVNCSPRKSVFASIHGQEAITDIQVVPERHTEFDSGTSWILTTGRDGRFAIHQITFPGVERGDRGLKLETYHESSLPFGPRIEGAYFDKSSQELFIWGFHSTQFVVWNERTKARVMSIDCGGAHRHWAYSPPDDGKGGGRFVWTKASACNVLKQTEGSHNILESGGHGREIKAIAAAPYRERSDGLIRPLIATGAEDTAIRLFEYDIASGYRCVQIITKHTTGIQKLQWSGTRGQFLFSAAGCEEFFIWQVSQVPNLGSGSTCRVVCPTVTPDKDLRIMDFTMLDIHHPAPAAEEGYSLIHLVAVVYSDSSVRIFAFHSTGSRECSLTLLLESAYMTQCLTQVVFIQLSSETYLCTASTDGYLAFWPLGNYLKDHGFCRWDSSSILFNPKLQSKDPPKTFSWQKRFRVHQNSVKGLLRIPLSSEDFLLVTCGDDEALALTRVAAQATVSPDDSLKQAVLLLPGAHASAVTALTYLGSKAEQFQTRHYFATVGNDQQLKIWEIIDCMEGEGVERFKIRKKIHVHTSVADASSLSAFAAGHNEPIRLCVAGIGMETWSFQDGLLLLHNE